MGKENKLMDKRFGASDSSNKKLKMQKFDLAKDSNKINLHKDYIGSNNNQNIDKNPNEMKPYKKELTKLKSVEKFEVDEKKNNLNINIDKINRESPIRSSASLRVEEKEIASDSDEEVQNK